VTTTTASRADFGRRRRRSLRDLPWGAIAAGVVIVGAEVVVGAAIADERFLRLAAPVAGVLGLAFLFRFPFAGSVVFMALASSFFYATLFSFSAGPLRVEGVEVVLAGLLLVALVRPRNPSWGGAVALALAAFLGVVLVATVLAILGDRVSLNEAANWGRAFALLTFFYVVVRLFPERVRHDRLLIAGCVLGALTGVVSLLISFSDAPAAFFQDPGNQFITDDEGLGVIKRVRLPGVALSYGLFYYAVVKLVGSAPRHRLGWLALLVGMALNIAVSFNRNMWLGLLIGFAVLLLAGGAQVRRRLIVGVALAAIGVGLLVVSGPEVSSPQSALRPIVERGRTLLDPSAVSKEQSLRDRETETVRAWEALDGHMLTGLGVGAPWGSYFRQSQGGGRLILVPQLFLHNQYLYLIVVGGVFALAAFLAFLLIALWKSWVGRRDPTVAACGVGLVMIMASAFVMLSFTSENFLITIALLAGAIVNRERPDGPAPD
jgi:O-antigen ligase